VLSKLEWVGLELKQIELELMLDMLKLVHRPKLIKLAVDKLKLHIHSMIRQELKLKLIHIEVELTKKSEPIILKPEIIIEVIAVQYSEIIAEQYSKKSFIGTIESIFNKERRPMDITVDIAAIDVGIVDSS
jgi:hypothetical protein